jgi:hypothetical protein
LNKGIEKLGLAEVTACDYLADLQNTLCMIVREGNLYRFSHRSFQTYFAAYYTAKGLSKRELRLFFSEVTCNSILCLCLYNDYLDLLYQIAPNEIGKYSVWYNLQHFLDKADASPDPDLFFLKGYYQLLAQNADPSCEKSSKLMREFCVLNKKYFKKEADGPFKQTVLEYLDKTPALVAEFHEIRTSPRLTDEERDARYREMIEREHIPQLRADIRQWLAEQDAKREALASSTDLSALLDAL